MYSFRIRTRGSFTYQCEATQNEVTHNIEIEMVSLARKYETDLRQGSRDDARAENKGEASFPKEGLLRSEIEGGSGRGYAKITRQTRMGISIRRQLCICRARS